MAFQYRVTLSGIKGFYRVYRMGESSTLYAFHKQMRADMEFPADQLPATASSTSVTAPPTRSPWPIP